MNQPNRATRRAMDRAGVGIPMQVPDLSALANQAAGMGDGPTLREQRRSAAIQLAIQGIHSFEDADAMVAAASTIEGFLMGQSNDAPYLASDEDAGDDAD